MDLLSGSPGCRTRCADGGLRPFALLLGAIGGDRIAGLIRLLSVLALAAAAALAVTQFPAGAQASVSAASIASRRSSSSPRWRPTVLGPLRC